MEKRSNNRTGIALGILSCFFGLAILFMPEEKARLYIPIPSVLMGAAAAMLTQSQKGE